MIKIIHIAVDSREASIFLNYSITIRVEFLFLSRFPETNSNKKHILTVSVYGARSADRHNYHQITGY